MKSATDLYVLSITPESLWSAVVFAVVLLAESAMPEEVVACEG
ncbi:hypothetical protein [Thalassolituus oleivorans]|nr:hypothetical protein [Thalassolituus oleivorans]